jgi:predicted amidophosphoribosyltransferase
MSRRIRIFRRREQDDLLERSMRTCPGCRRDVHVFAAGCRHCGQELDIAS